MVVPIIIDGGGQGQGRAIHELARQNALEYHLEREPRHDDRGARQEFRIWIAIAGRAEVM